MSLIGDALRKARQEAAERESDRKGILFSAKIAEGPTRSNLGLGLALGALIAVIATVAGGVAVWWILGVGDTPQDQPAAEATAAILEPTPEPASASVPENSDSGSEHRPPATHGEAEAGSGAGAGTGAEAGAGAAPETGAGTASGTGAGTLPDREGPSGGGGGSEQRPETAAGPQDPTTSGPETGFIGKENGEEIYIMEADLGDVRLSLDFLIFREVDPFAEINGVEVHLGGTIGGFRVKAIERDRVRLSNGRRTIVLRAP